ncbi:MAG: hypothetical protein LBI33_04790 [Propionibacteriaceae bacterium]|jgi:hypothetical protein|nr:hypothetical protein [Propionibacteriaceae bacterium]
MSNESSEKIRHPRRRVIIVVVAIVVVLALVAGFAVWWGHRSTGGQTTTTTRTATVERTSLVAGFRLSGTLGYGDAVALGGGGGVVTHVPAAGDFIAAGKVVMEVEGVPVFLLQGDLPLWREIGPGVAGPDVAMVRKALATLGFAAGTEGQQAYDQDLSNAIGAMYAAAGYPTVPPSTEQQTLRATTLATLGSAKDSLTNAQDALAAAKNHKPSQPEIVAANNAVNEAQRTLDAMIRGECPGDELTGTTGCTQAQIANAQDALNLAKAQRDDLLKPPDTSAQQSAVTSATQAVANAQADYDKALLNTVSPQSVLIVPEPEVRIDSVQAKLGLAASGTVLTWTKTLLYGRADLTDAQRRLLATGTKAIMTLPDSTEVDGVVEELIDAKTDPTTMQQIPASARITINDQTLVSGLGVSAITISFVQDEVEAALVVPVTALMALAEGGYCVQRPDGTLVAVKVGLIADTRAQVESDQLREGDEVIIP